jgi:hypothetical protein
VKQSNKDVFEFSRKRETGKQDAVGGRTIPENAKQISTNQAASSCQDFDDYQPRNEKKGGTRKNGQREMAPTVTKNWREYPGP